MNLLRRIQSRRCWLASNAIALTVAAMFVVPASLLAVDTPELKIAADFPGGSARVEGVDQKNRIIKVLPTPHVDRGWVCWWYFKLEGVRKGETITLDLGGGVWATPDRASYSLDNKEWKTTEPGKREKDRIVYRIVAEAETLWFAWGPPFVLNHAQDLIERSVRASKYATAFELCKSKDGHPVPGIRVQQPGVRDIERLGIWVQARQHAWESGSSWVCKGFVEWLMSDDAVAESLRKKATIHIVPIMDIDNVERGAGGKNQKPHDHNRDWTDKPVYPEVLAAQKQITDLHKAGQFDLFIDLHNPSASDKHPFFFVAPPELLSVVGRRNLDAFLEAGRKEITGPLKIAAKPHESGANYDKMWKSISKNWVTELTKNHTVAVTLETSWNTPASTTIGYQRVGKELGLTIERYFRDATRAVPKP